MLKNNNKRQSNKRRGQRGYTLLEYCAGAALLLAIVWGGMNALGGSMRGYLERVGGWLDSTTFESAP